MPGNVPFFWYLRVQLKKLVANMCLHMYVCTPDECTSVCLSAYLPASLCAFAVVRACVRACVCVCVCL